MRAYQSKGVRMEPYLGKVKELFMEFEHYMIVYILWEKNADVNMSVKLSNSKDAHLLGSVPLETLQPRELKAPKL